MTTHNPIDDDIPLKKPLTWSVGIHVGLILFLILSTYWTKKPTHQLEQVISAQLVPLNATQLNELSTPPIPKVKEAPKTEATKKPDALQAKHETVEAAKKPKPTKAEKPAPAKVEKPKEPTPPVQTLPKQEVITEKNKMPKPKEAPKKPEEKKPDVTPPKPVETAKPEEKQPDDGTPSFLKSVKEMEKQQKDATPNPTPAPEAKEDKAANGTAQKPAENLSFLERLTADKVLSGDELAALRQQMAECWNIPAGAKSAENLIVELHLIVGPDGVVQSAEVADTARMNDPFYRAAAESALRAVKNPHCSPLKLPADKYEKWRELILQFDPKQMLGG